MSALFFILVFPGFIFLSLFGLIGQFVDRKIYARLQNRIGPPWYQPFADFIKLLAKEDIVPEEANPRMFSLMPLFSLTAVITAFLYIPLWGIESLFSFNGDLIVVLYLLTLPTLAFFIGGWYSTSLYARIGSVRTLTQLCAYEIPLFIGILSSALLANTWSLSEIALFYHRYPWYWTFNIIGFAVSLLALLGKLEKVPFDIPEAETEIVAGCFTEYSGRRFAFFKLTLDIEMIVGASLLTAVFLPFGLTLNPILSFIIFIIKIFVVIGLISLVRSLFARLRMDQMMRFCLKYLTPIALLQLLINIFLKGFLYR
ncbi:MAG: NADH-quinone oxidoreductase subunit H [Candidatus Omnitrophica bacterium]|nr:NADH-quinone oxidoreductase subunit H [Candidatus Omnitrophota bacterium]